MKTFLRCRQNSTKLARFFDNSVNSNMMQTSRDVFEPKFQISHFLGEVCFGIHFQTFPLDCNTRELQPEKLTTNERDSFQQAMQQFSPTERKRKEVVSISLVYIITIFAHRVPEMYASRKSQIFL